MNILQKIVISVAAIIATTDISFAQTFSNTPNDTINIVGMMEDLETLSIQQQNTSGKTITLKWQKVSENVPSIWEASVCDNVTCNTSLVDSGTMNPVKPDEYGLLLLHITAHVNYGTATIRYAVWDVANPSIKDTLTYILTINATSSITKTENKINFNVFPNPSNDFINISTPSTEKYSVEIFNSLGEKIISSPNNIYNSQFYIYNYANGLYTISIFTNNKKIINTKQFLIYK